MAEQDSRSSLKHILADEPPEETPQQTRASSPPPATEAADAAPASERDPDDDENREEGSPHYTAITQTTRRNANGSVSSVFSGNKIRHLKKEDGVPLWRRDIQYEFLQALFEDPQKVFTRISDRSYGHTFAEIYIDTLAQSSKTSKILKEKLVQDHASALTMAMVCLLVNVGRMNTTLNFFPEMRAQLRTYHSIPALQAHQDPHAYKQLQDAPRLKSILKGASEDDPQPGTLDEIKLAKRPRTNPVNLIFVLAQYAPKVTEMHFNPPRDFFDLVMRPTLSSKSRARAFLWLVWWYLESDYSEADALANPFGAGAPGEGADGLPIKVPPFDVLTEEQAALENVDTDDEKTFGEQKRKERMVIVNSEPSPAMTALKRARKERNIFRPGYVPSEYEGTTTPGRDDGSPVPHGSVQSSNAHRGEYGSEDGGSPSPPPAPYVPRVEDTPSRSSATVVSGSIKLKGPGRGNWRRGKAAPSDPAPTSSAAADEHLRAASSPRPRPSAAATSAVLPPHIAAEILARNTGEPAPAPGSSSTAANSKKMRPLTHHQLAISEYRRVRVRRILERGVQKTQIASRRSRVREGALLRAWTRIRRTPSGWDSEEEEARAGRDEGGGTTSSGNNNNKDGGGGGGGDSSGGGSGSMDFESGPDGKLWGRQLGKSGMVMTRPVGGCWMAGFVMPGLGEVEDCGEEFGHLSRIMGEVRGRILLEKGEGMDADRRWVRRKSVTDLYEEEIGKDPLDVGARPRLVRKNVGRGRGRGKGRGGAGGRSTGIKEEGDEGRDDADGIRDAVEDEEGLDGEEGEEGEDEMEVDEVGLGHVEEDADQAELDEEDRELLGEMDAGDTDDASDDDDDDEGERDGDGGGGGQGDAMDQS